MFRHVESKFDDANDISVFIWFQYGRQFPRWAAMRYPEILPFALNMAVSSQKM